MGILGTVGLGMRIFKTKWSGLRGGQDEGREIEMIWVCEEEICECPCKKV